MSYIVALHKKSAMQMNTYVSEMLFPSLLQLFYQGTGNNLRTNYVVEIVELDSFHFFVVLIMWSMIVMFLANLLKMQIRSRHGDFLQISKGASLLAAMNFTVTVLGFCLSLKKKYIYIFSELNYLISKIKLINLLNVFADLDFNRQTNTRQLSLV